MDISQLTDNHQWRQPFILIQNTSNFHCYNASGDTANLKSLVFNSFAVNDHDVTGWMTLPNDVAGVIMLVAGVILCAGTLVLVLQKST